MSRIAISAEMCKEFQNAAAYLKPLRGTKHEELTEEQKERINSIDKFVSSIVLNIKELVYKYRLNTCFATDSGKLVLINGYDYYDHKTYFADDIILSLEKENDCDFIKVIVEENAPNFCAAHKPFAFPFGGF